MTVKSCGFIALAAIVICLPAGAETRSSLPARYQQWLTEEVAYIIAPRERDVFLALKTDRERDIFIEAFWKQRDPSPGTERNEFKEEHYRRLEYANAFYGRSTPLPGWKTDRGRIYIILGPPKNIESYDQVTNVFPDGNLVLSGRPRPRAPDRLQCHFLQEDGYRGLCSLFSDQAMDLKA